MKNTKPRTRSPRTTTCSSGCIPPNCCFPRLHKSGQRTGWCGVTRSNIQTLKVSCRTCLLGIKVLNKLLNREEWRLWRRLRLCLHQNSNGSKHRWRMAQLLKMRKPWKPWGAWERTCKCSLCRGRWRNRGRSDDDFSKELGGGGAVLVLFYDCHHFRNPTRATARFLVYSARSPSPSVY